MTTSNLHRFECSSMNRLKETGTTKTPIGATTWSPNRNQRAKPLATPPPHGLSTRGDDQISGGTLGGFATGVGTIGSPVALCHWKRSFTASKRLVPITPPPVALCNRGQSFPCTNVSRDAQASGLNRTLLCDVCRSSTRQLALLGFYCVETATVATMDSTNLDSYGDGLAINQRCDFRCGPLIA